MQEAVAEMGTAQGFRGYGPEQGYEFLREAISKNDYKSKNIEISTNEIFVSDGSKCDCGNIVDIFAKIIKLQLLTSLSCISRHKCNVRKKRQIQ